VTPARKSRPDDLPEDELGQVHDEDGLVVDEYTSEAFDDPDDLDAMDVPAALVNESVLDEIADDADGIEEVDVAAGGAPMDTVDTGARRPANDDADMGFGAEPRSPEELERAAIGGALKGKAGVTRDDEVHGERLLDARDAPDAPDAPDAGENAE
jgi:hypothetical protein